MFKAIPFCASNERNEQSFVDFVNFLKVNKINTDDQVSIERCINQEGDSLSKNDFGVKAGKKYNVRFQKIILCLS